MLFEEVKNQSVDQGPLLILLVLDKLGSSLLFAGGSHIIEMIMKLMILLLCSSFSLSFFFPHLVFAVCFFCFRYPSINMGHVCLVP